MSGIRSNSAGRQTQPEPLADSLKEWLDFGDIKIPVMDGIVVSATLDDNQNIVNINLRSDSSELRIAVFAANRGHSLWDEMRREIRASLFAEGLPTQEVDGEAGTELLTRRRDPYGVTPQRLVGIDGPGWMIRGIYTGPAALDTARAEGLANCLRNAVVRVSNPSLRERSPLPLTMPPGTEQSG
jgi:plasmid stability protein